MKKVTRSIQALTTMEGTIVLILLLASAVAVHGQSSLTDGHTPVGIAPGAPAGSYALSGFDNVNLFNGNLNFNLPLLRVGGRGEAHTTMMLPFEMRWGTTIQPTCVGCTPIEYAVTLPWHSAPPFNPGFMEGRYSVAGLLNCGPNINAELPAYTLSRITFVESDGTEFELRDQQSDGRPALVPAQACATNVPQGYSRGRVFRTADGSAATFISDQNIVDSLALSANQLYFYPSGILYLRDGTIYTVWHGLIKRITDPNGNYVTFTYENDDNPSPVVSHDLTAIKDSLNRTVSINYPDSSHADTQITFIGTNGTPRTIHVWLAQLDQALRSGFSISTYHDLFPELNNSDTTPFDPAVVSAVELPDTRRYQFKYNQYGEIARVELPTGGAFEYDYAGSGIPGNDGAVTDENGIHVMIYRRMIERRVYQDSSGTSPWIERTTYALSNVSPPNTVTIVSHYGPDGLLASEWHYFTGSPLKALDEQPIEYSAWNSGKEYRTETYDENGTPLRTVTQTWWQRSPMSWNVPGNGPGEPPNDPRMVETVTYLVDANLVSKQTSIDPGDPSGQTVRFDQFNNQTDQWEYDYGVGAPPPYAVRHTHTDYLTVNPVNGIDYTAYDPNNPSRSVLRSLPRGQQVYAVYPSNGVETLAAQSETKYDETSLTQYSTVTSWSDPGTLARGNATTVRRWLDQTGTNPNVTNTWLETHAGYDQCGNIISKTDALGHQTSISYLDAFADGNNARNTFAFPTTTTFPAPDPTGQNGSTSPLVSTSVYEFNIGAVVSATDVNGRTTTLGFADPQTGVVDKLDRLKTVARPDGGITTYNYGDTAGSLYVETLTKQDVTLNIDKRTYFDGLGRAIRSFLYDATPNTPWSVTDTYYDGLGRVSKVSNPYRVGSPSATLPTKLFALHHHSV